MKKRPRHYHWSCRSCGSASRIESVFAPEGRTFQKQLNAAHGALSPRCDVKKARIMVLPV